MNISMNISMNIISSIMFTVKLSVIQITVEKSLIFDDLILRAVTIDMFIIIITFVSLATK